MSDAPIYLTNKTVKVPGHIAAVGPTAQLAAAYHAGTPVTLSGKYGGERVYLGHTQQIYGDDGITVETIGEDDTWTHEGQEIAAYLIDFKRLNDAPRLAALVEKVTNRRLQRAMELDARAQAEEAELARPEDA